MLKNSFQIELYNFFLAHFDVTFKNDISVDRSGDQLIWNMDYWMNYEYSLK